MQWPGKNAVRNSVSCLTTKIHTFILDFFIFFFKIILAMGQIRTLLPNLVDKLNTIFNFRIKTYSHFYRYGCRNYTRRL